MNEPVTNFKRLTRSVHVLSHIISRNMQKPYRCKFCANKAYFGKPEYCPCDDDNYDECRKHIKKFLEQEAP